MKNRFLVCVLMGLLPLLSFCQAPSSLAFSLKNIDGKTISLENFNKEKGVIVIFVSNGCPVSEMYQPRIAALHAKYAAEGFPVVTIDPADSFEKMKDRATAKKYPYYFLHDADQQITKNYHVTTNTHTFVLQNTPKGFKLVLMVP